MPTISKCLLNSHVYWDTAQYIQCIQTYLYISMNIYMWKVRICPNFVFQISEINRKNVVSWSLNQLYSSHLFIWNNRGRWQLYNLTKQACECCDWFKFEARVNMIQDLFGVSVVIQFNCRCFCFFILIFKKCIKHKKCTI